MKFFQEEKWTWRLLRVLFQDRFDRQSENKQDTLEEVDEQTTIFQNFFIFDDFQNEEYRELMLVRSWCEMNAAEVLNGDGKVQFFAEKLFVGENTLHNIKGGRHGEMDVDAALRNPRQQDELDKVNITDFIEEKKT